MDLQANEDRGRMTVADVEGKDVQTMQRGEDMVLAMVLIEDVLTSLLMMLMKYLHVLDARGNTMNNKYCCCCCCRNQHT